MSPLAHHRLTARMMIAGLFPHVAAPPPSCFAAGVIAAAAALALTGGWDGHRMQGGAAPRLAGPASNETMVVRAAPGAPSVARNQKADRLGVAKVTTAGFPVAAVEVIGAENVSILFRSRFGQMVFQTDPLTATTYIAKDLAWPPFVVRSKHPSPIEQRFPEQEKAPAPGRRPIGCEPITSDVADPTGSGIIGRCIAMLVD